MIQEILEMHLDTELSFDNFWVNPQTGTAKTVEYLKQLSTHSNASSYYLVGAKSAGKSHLLQALCAKLTDSIQSIDLSTNQLQYNGSKWVLIDNIELLATNNQLQREFFALYNQLQANVSNLIVTSDTVPSMLNLTIQDVQSRLQAATLLPLDAPTDEDRVAILQFRAARQGLIFDDKTVNYLMMRSSRDLHTLMQYLYQFHVEGLRHQKKLSISLIKETLNW